MAKAVKKPEKDKPATSKKVKTTPKKTNYFDKQLWKEIIIGVAEAIIWCTVIFLLVYNYSEEIIEMIQFMADNVDKVLALYFCILPIFIIIAITLKIGSYTLKSNIKKK